MSARAPRRDRRTRHDLADGLVQTSIGPTLEESGQVAVGEQPYQPARIIKQHDRPGASANMSRPGEDLAHARRRAGDAQVRAAAHERGHWRELAPQAAGGVKAREVFRAEVAGRSECEGDGVAERHHDRGNSIEQAVIA